MIHQSFKKILSPLFVEEICECPSIFVRVAVIEKLEKIATTSELDRVMVLEAIINVADTLKIINVDEYRNEYTILFTKHRKALSRKKCRLIKQWQ